MNFDEKSVLLLGYLITVQTISVINYFRVSNVIAALLLISRIYFLWASPSFQGILELSYFGHGKAFLRSNSISLQLRIRKQTELIRK